MSDPPKDPPKPADPPKPRAPTGQYLPEKEKDNKGSSTPKTSDYTKMNSFMAIQLGLSDKIAEWQTEYSPSELFSKLEFMMSNSKVETKEKDKLPPNEKIVPTSSQADTEKIKIPGFTVRKEMDSKDGAFHGDISLMTLKKIKK